MRRRLLILVTGLTLVCGGLATASPSSDEAESDIPRTADGRPDLSGTYDIATLTPLQRSPQFGDNLYMSKEEADNVLKQARQFIVSAESEKTGGAEREAPPVGGDGSGGASGNVGGYNAFWIDPGDSIIEVDGMFRTSIITDPPNGRQPPTTPEEAQRRRIFADFFRPNDGTAYWLDWDRPGPYDNPEQMFISDRCLASYRQAVPSLPSIYNNMQRIVQTEEYVMILNEMIHDARIVRMSSEHEPPEIKSWLGDSIGWWDGDTLVVDTTNFRAYQGFASATETLHVVERFTRQDAETLHYEFTVEDPSVWTAPWSGDLLWNATEWPEERIYEYACHEGNYAMGNILRGARLLEREALENKDGE